MLAHHTIGCRRGSAASVLLPVVLLILLGTSGRLVAAPISREQALETAYAWASLSREAMHEQHGPLAGTATAVRDALGETEYYAVDLKPKGYVIVAADDGVEPIIAFSSTDVFQAAPGHPLYDMLRGDVPARISRARAGQPAAVGKWRMLRAIAQGPKVLTQEAITYTAGSATGVSDVRVAPLIKSKWDQLTAYGQALYNYYTPPNAAGNTKNYYSGCVATMLAQIMRFHEWPQTGVGTGSYSITVNNTPAQRSLRGGDGAGGSYAWDAMPLTASADMPASQLQAIGALVADAGVASEMDYGPNGSSAYIKASVLTDVFHYANAVFSSAQLSILNDAIKANLDAGLPVGLGVSGGGVGHAIVADGYGYNATTLYHHLNMGWSGADNAWYNLPAINVGFDDFKVVNGALFNIDPKVTGEIVSGRVTDSAGKPVAGEPVSLTSGSVVITATTNVEGIYAVKGLGSNTTWNITPSGGGRVFDPASLTVTTGNSGQGGTVGDKTGQDFASWRQMGGVEVTINAGAVANGAEWRVDRGPWFNSGVTENGILVGMHALTFRAARGWIAPAESIIIVGYNQTTISSVNYTPQYSLTGTPDNAAHGQVTADPTPGELGSYARDTRVALTATAAAGYYFGGWVESGTLVNTDVTYPVVVKCPRQLVANFPPVSLTGTNTQLYITSNRSEATIHVLADLNDTGGTPGVLSVTQPANGTVTINADGTLTFTPGPNFHGSTQFSYVAGDGGGTITRAVDISNWFAASAGTYAGLSLANEVTNESSGYLKATVTSSGAFSGKLSVAGMSYSLSGAFDAKANYEKVIARSGSSSLNMGLHLDPVTEITGTISDGVTESNLAASRVIFNRRNKASEAGRYTALLSGSSVVPGNGYLIVAINPSGNVTATGRLADGTPVATGAYLNADGSVPYYAGVYKSPAGAGSVLGTMVFQPDTATECMGVYTWFRPNSTGAYYPGGFEESGDISGSMVPEAARASRLLSEQPPVIAVELSGGGLETQIDETGQLMDDGKFQWTAPNGASLTLTAGTTGKVTGWFVDPATGKKRAVLGVWLPKLQLGGGFFLGDSSAGGLTLSGQ